MKNVSFFVDLERSVWDALVVGDAEADQRCLSEDFLGVYPTGFADAVDHAAQLADGPTIDEYRIENARTLEITDGHVMLSYLAAYRRPDRDDEEQMFVSSLWSLIETRWINVFSQDTPVGDPVV